MQTDNTNDNTPNSEPVFVVTQDIVAKFPVTARTLQDWRSRYDMPNYKIGKTIFYEWSEVLAFIRRHRKGK